MCRDRFLCSQQCSPIFLSDKAKGTVQGAVTSCSMCNADHKKMWTGTEIWADFTYLLKPIVPTPAIALCSGLLWSFRTSWSPAVSALLQCLASNCCVAGLSSSSPAGSRSGLGVWCWMLDSCGCVRSSPTSSAVSAWPLVPVPLAPTDLHFGSSLAIGFCRCASDRCWRMSWSFVSSSVLSTMSHIRKAGLTSHWFSCWFLQMPRCFWA